MHQWLMSFDVNSLYPNLIRQINISPETMIEQDKIKISVDELLLRKKLSIDDDKTLAANGVLFQKNKFETESAFGNNKTTRAK